MGGTTSQTARRLVHAGGAVFGASTLFFLVLAVDGGDVFDARDDILLFSFAAAALLAIAGWGYERRAASAGLDRAMTSDAERPRTPASVETRTRRSRTLLNTI